MNARSAAQKARNAKGKAQPEPISLRAQLKQHTRDRLVSGAIELFAEKGYRATSVAEIAAAAGTTPTTFYRYFATKSDIARLLQEQINVEVKKTLEALDAMKRPTRAAVREWINQYVAMWERQHVLCDAFWEATSTDPALAAELVPITERLTESLEVVKAVPEGRVRKKFRARLVMMYLLMDRLLYLVDIQAHNATAMRMLDEFSEILWQSLFAGDLAARREEPAEAAEALAGAPPAPKRRRRAD